MLADAISGRRSSGTIKTMGYPDNFVTKILCLSGGEYLVGFYGGGVVKSIKPFRLVDRRLEKTRFNVAPIFSVTKNDFPKLPSSLKPLTIDELKLMQTKLERLRTALSKPYAVYYGEDWKTKGDWLGRTTKNWAIMCSGVAPLDTEEGWRIGRFWKKLDEAYAYRRGDGLTYNEKGGSCYTNCLGRWRATILKSLKRQKYFNGS